MLAYIRQRMSGRVLVWLEGGDVGAQLADEPASAPAITSTARRVVAISSSGRQSAGLFGKPADLFGKGRMIVEAKVERANLATTRQSRPGFSQSTSHTTNRVVIIR